MEPDEVRLTSESKTSLVDVDTSKEDVVVPQLLLIVIVDSLKN